MPVLQTTVELFWIGVIFALGFVCGGVYVINSVRDAIRGQFTDENQGREVE